MIHKPLGKFKYQREYNGMGKTKGGFIDDMQRDRMLVKHTIHTFGARAIW